MEERRISIMMKVINSILKTRFIIKKKTLLDSTIDALITRPKRECTSTMFPSSTGNKHLFYFHGGAYINGLQSIHTSFIKQLQKQYPLSIHLIDYPLGPESTYEETISSTLYHLLELVKSNQIESLIMAGDSAGGGLAYVMSHLLKESNIHVEHIILLSPWLDLTNQQLHPTTDYILSKAGLDQASNLYANHARNTKEVSPLLHDMAPMCSVQVFTSTSDILYQDSIRFMEKYPKVSTVVSYNQAPHDFALFPKTPEQKQVIQDIVKHLKTLKP